MYFYTDPSFLQNFLYFPFLGIQGLQNGQYVQESKVPSPLTNIQSQNAEGGLVKLEEQACRRGNNQNMSNQMISKAMQRKGNKVDKDELYDPKSSERKFVRRNKQDQNRNVVPNLIHQMLSFIQKKQRSGIFVGRAFSRFQHCGDCSVKRFYLYQKKLKEKVNSYVNEDTLKLLNILHQPQCSVYSEQEQQFYLKVCRVIVHHFLNHQVSSIVLTSQKMNRDKKKDHIEARRYIQKKLLSIYNKEI